MSSIVYQTFIIGLWFGSINRLLYSLFYYEVLFRSDNVEDRRRLLVINHIRLLLALSGMVFCGKELLN
jgi:hypothetical protein